VANSVLRIMCARPIAQYVLLRCMGLFLAHSDQNAAVVECRQLTELDFGQKLNALTRRAAKVKLRVS
jgi:hypothetical protein